MTKNAKEIRKNILKISHRVKSAHIGSNLSCTDILSALYFDIINIPRVETSQYATRDIFILSKAHSALALYCTLYQKGLMEKFELNSYYTDEGLLPAHLDRFASPYIEVSAGSLGHGLPMALGYALALNDSPMQRCVFCLMGDGEVQEGSVWEAAMLAPKLNLGNLVAIIDYNNLQGYGRATELVSFEPLRDKWLAFGWECTIVDGHSETEITSKIKYHLKNSPNKPFCLICKTIKGKGVSFMEDKLEWHYYAISDEEYKQALKELL